MSDTSEDDKTEPASDKRRREFRERGEVAKSQELASAVMLFGGVGAILLMLYGLAPMVLNSTRGIFSRLHEYENFMGGSRNWLGGLAIELIFAALPPFGLLCLFGVIAHMGQVGPMWSTKVFEPKPQKFNPFSGIKRLIASKDSVANLIRTLIKVVFLGSVSLLVLGVVAPDIRDLVAKNPIELGKTMLHITIYPFSACAGVMLLVGLADYAWQRYRMEERMKMTPDEVKREYKESEGDPMMKGRRRARHRELASINEMIQEVSAATVVINNPTHVSVALRYDPESGAPIVVAKGVDAIAKRIREAATTHDVPMMTRPPLARALHKNVEVGHYIPEEFFRAVAEILAYVYTQHGRRPS